MIVWKCCGYDAPIFFLFHLRSVFCMREYTETLEYRVAQSEFIPKNPEISEADRTGGEAAVESGGRTAVAHF